MEKVSVDEQWEGYEPPYDVSDELKAKLKNIHARMNDLLVFGHENDKGYLQSEMEKLCQEMMESFK